MNARLLVLVLLVSLTACDNNMKSSATATTSPADSAPIAARKPHQVISPNGSREDEYYWIRDDKRENPEMLAYVKA